MPIEIVFSNDFDLDGEMVRFAILKFSVRDNIKEPKYGAYIGFALDERCCSEIIDSTLTDTLEEAVEYLENTLILAFSHPDIAEMYYQLKMTKIGENQRI